jgi:hypothetical protein
VPGKKETGDADRPQAAGWYPDPWSATGEGERYFDGKKWGSSARPLARHTQTPPAPGASVTPITAGRRRKVGRFKPPRLGTGGPKGGGVKGWWARVRNRYGPLLILIALVLLVWGLPKILDSRHRNNDVFVEPEPTPLTVPVNRPPASTEEAAKPLGVPAPVPAGAGDFEMLLHQPDDANAPVAFDPCRPIHYVVNPAGAPADGAALLAAALARVQTATGLHFVNDGATTEKPDKQREAYLPSRYNSTRWAPVLIAWSDQAAYPELSGYVAGVAGPNTVDTVDSQHLVDVSGQVVFDRRQLSVAKEPNRKLVRAIMLHELGHLVGLDHTADKTQLMFSEAEFNRLDYASGDLHGLAELGTQPCYPNV